MPLSRSLRTSLVTAVATITAAAGGALAALPADATPHAVLARNVSVTIVDDAYMPMNRTVKVGKVVTWTWRAGNRNSHNVTITGPKRYHSATKRKGSYSVKFTKAGTYHVMCTIHGSYMTMTVKVVS